MDKINVAGKYDDSGTFLPTSFRWSRRTYEILEIGRRWEEAGDEHILCMAADNQVYELIFRPAQNQWFLGQHPPQRSFA